MAFMGVLISWLMFARKMDLASFASSAAFRLVSASSSASLTRAGLCSDRYMIKIEIVTAELRSRCCGKKYCTAANTIDKTE